MNEAMKAANALLEKPRPDDITEATNPARRAEEDSRAAPGSLNLVQYDAMIECETKSMISGEHKELVRYDQLPDIAVIKAWLADDDLQYLRVCSTNIGFIRTFQKRIGRDSENGTDVFA